MKIFFFRRQDVAFDSVKSAFDKKTFFEVLALIR